MLFSSKKSKLLLNKNRNVSVALLIFLCIIFLSQCISKTDNIKADIRGAEFIGSVACRDCHKDIYDNYIQTAHFNTSSNSLSDLVKAGFAENKNVFEFNDSLKVVMEKMNGNYFQSLYQNGQKTFSHPFDIVIGSGRKAQTYLYYDQEKVRQLPISYFMSEHSWANSPGFPSHIAKFDREIPSGCFGCHSSYAVIKQTYKGMQLEEEYERGQMIYGIDCERCHGPAREHAAYYKDHPSERPAKFIKSVKTLNRLQQNDMCSLCHSGFRDVQQSLFNFKPGNALSDFYFPDLTRPDPEHLDVHGKQSQLMMGSKCFQKSIELTCNSCHNVHVKERDNISAFSNRCQGCHKQVDHSFTKENRSLDLVTQNNCIDCHMPSKPSSLIKLLTKQKTSPQPDFIRTHLIKVYPEETKRFLDSVKKS